jgi:hypothetical protein
MKKLSERLFVPIQHRLAANKVDSVGKREGARLALTTTGFCAGALLLSYPSHESLVSIPVRGWCRLRQHISPEYD